MAAYMPLEGRINSSGGHPPAWGRFKTSACGMVGFEDFYENNRFGCFFTM